jgi:peptidyl-prolyl cis-trans isomerase A (cyclophilin A)
MTLTLRFLCLTALLIAFGLHANAQQPSLPQKPPRVSLNTTEGTIVIELYPQYAPKTVSNFLQYVKDKHYDGTIFHRVIENFMVQGGGFDSRFVQKATRAPVVHEGREALAAGGPRNLVGTVAMARTSDPHSASAQFFINVKDNAFLDSTVIPAGDPVKSIVYQGREVQVNAPREALINDPRLWGYTVFGKVVSGMDVVNKIKSVPTGRGGPFPGDVPQTTITIKSASLEK